MSNHCKQYTVMEVKRLIQESEGRKLGPKSRSRGHALSQHGSARIDVTDRGKPKDGAFHRGWEVNVKNTTSLEDSIMRGVFDDYQPTSHTNRFTDSSDQYLAICNALNSERGQKKLAELDALADVGTVSKVFQAPVKLGLRGGGSLIPTQRTGSGNVESARGFSKVHIELFKISGVLHIHTAFAISC